MSAIKTLARATIVIAVINLISRLFGFVREMVIARQFGASGVTDAYLVAYTIPYVLMNVLSLSLATVVVPIFSEYASKGKKKEAWKLFATVTNLTGLAFVVIVILGTVFSHFLVSVTAPGLTPDIQRLSESLTRWMLPMIIFMGVSNLFNGLLNANNEFALPSFTVVVANIIVILCTVILGKMMGIYGVAVGVVVSMFVSMVIQIPALRRHGFQYRLSFDWHQPGVKKVMALMLPVSFGVSINQLYIVIDRMLASNLPVGSISAIYFSNRILFLPLGMFVMAIGTAFYPTLTRQAVNPAEGDMGLTMRKALRLVILTSLPAGVGLMVLGHPIVQLLFQRGLFDAHATDMTAYALMFFSIGLVGQSANVMLTRGFYALQDTRTPVKMTVVTVVVNLIFSLLLMGPLKQGGLALANSIAALVNTTMLSWVLSRRVQHIWTKDMLRFNLQVLLASVVMGGVVYLLNYFTVGIFAPMGSLGLLIQLALLILIAMVVFLLAVIMLRLEETDLIFKYLRRIVPIKRI